MIATESNGTGRLADDDRQFVAEFGETKIQAQHRWVREGIAEQAAAFRMKVRKKGQAAGLKGAERGLRAWRATMEKFPTSERKLELAIRARFKLADFTRDRGLIAPGSGAPALPGELAFADLWAAVYELLSEEFYWQDPPRDAEDELEGPYTAERATKHVANSLQMDLQHDLREVGRSPARNASLGWAIVDLGGFLAYAETSITRELQRLEELDVDDSDDAINQLTTALAEVVRMRQPYIEREERMAAADAARVEEATAAAT